MVNLDFIGEAMPATLMNLIVGAESVSDFEKKEWFSRYPNMSVEQRMRLYNIFETERVKLIEIEAIYAESVLNLMGPVPASVLFQPK